eukprot:COSAG06_NODE_1371_length_9670_cov_42.650402_3_plen_154_part_00
MLPRCCCAAAARPAGTVSTLQPRGPTAIIVPTHASRRTRSGMAAQMAANFVYLVADGASGQCATACWDCAGVKRVADELGLTIVAAWYTHTHFNQGGGVVPEWMTGGAKVTLEGAQDMAALGAEVLVGSADAAELQAQCGLAALTPLSRTARS